MVVGAFEYETLAVPVAVPRSTSLVLIVAAPASVVVAVDLPLALVDAAPDLYVPFVT